MQLRLFTLMMILVTAVLMVTACKKEDDDNGDDDGDASEEKISMHNGKESHNAGKNCMTCHVSGGSGEGWFVAAGTVYDKQQANVYPNATVKLYDAPNGGGNLVATIEVDAYGNFYTTKDINYGSGLYPAVQGGSTTQYMGSMITKGACNSCHGVTTSKIWTE